jgi:hypothetical protein
VRKFIGYYLIIICSAGMIILGVPVVLVLSQMPSYVLWGIIFPILLIGLIYGFYLGRSSLFKYHPYARPTPNNTIPITYPHKSIGLPDTSELKRDTIAAPIKRRIPPMHNTISTRVPNHFQKPIVITLSFLSHIAYYIKGRIASKVPRYSRTE